MNIKEYINNFGLKIFLIKTVRKPFYSNFSHFGKNICLINENIIKRFLEKNIISDLKSLDCTKTLYINADVPKNSIIWTMWWQGLDSAPYIVKKCIANLKKKNPSRKVIVITKKNYQKYIHLNSEIICKLNKGKISVTHFSDIYRTNLLYIYGGVWIDSTVWVTKKIDDQIFNQDFYSIKTGKYTNDPSHGRWTGFFLEAKANNALLNFIRRCFEIYSKKYDIFIDYILFDYFIDLAIDNNDIFSKMILEVPYNNRDTFGLQDILNEAFNVDFFKDNTYLYKLTYKKNFLSKTQNGELTFYGMLIK